MADTRGVSSGDILALTLLAAVAGPAAGAALTARWPQVVGWAVDVGVLVPSAAHPLLVLPQSSAGLDLPRLAIALACAGLLVLIPVMLIRRAWIQRQAIQ